MKSIKLKLILANVGVVLFSVLLITIPVIIIQYNSKVSDIADDAEDKITQGHSQINLFMEEPISIVHTVSHYLNTHPDDKDNIEEFFEQLLNGKSDFSELYYAGAVPVKNGGFFWANDRWNPPSDYDQTTRAWFKAGQSVQSGNIAVSDPYLDSVTNSMVAALSTSVRKNGSFAGVVALDMQLKELNNLVSPIKLSRSGQSFLLDKSGRYVTNEDSSKLMNANFFDEFALSDYKNNIHNGETFFAENAGKGFAVVADEIRKLSETSTTQSKTIGDQLSSIKNSINSVVTASKESSEAFTIVADKIRETDQLVRQIKSAMEEQQEGSRQITDSLHTMNDSTIEVRTASEEMSIGNKQILDEVRRLQDATTVMKGSMEEMSIGAKKINSTGAMLTEIAGKMKTSISQIGSQIDQFKV